MELYKLEYKNNKKIYKKLFLSGNYEGGGWLFSKNSNIIQLNKPKKELFKYELNKNKDKLLSFTFNNEDMTLSYNENKYFKFNNKNINSFTFNSEEDITLFDDFISFYTKLKQINRIIIEEKKDVNELRISYLIHTLISFKNTRERKKNLESKTQVDTIKQNLLDYIKNTEKEIINILSELNTELKKVKNESINLFLITNYFEDYNINIILDTINYYKDFIIKLKNNTSLDMIMKLNNEIKINFEETKKEKNQLEMYEKLSNHFQNKNYNELTTSNYLNEKINQIKKINENKIDLFEFFFMKKELLKKQINDNIPINVFKDLLQICHLHIYNMKKKYKEYIINAKINNLINIDEIKKIINDDKNIKNIITKSINLKEINEEINKKIDFSDYEKTNLEEKIKDIIIGRMFGTIN